MQYKINCISTLYLYKETCNKLFMIKNDFNKIIIPNWYY